MKNIAILLLLLLAAGPLAAQDGGKAEQLVVALSNPGKPGRLRLSLVQGSISVVGYNGKDVVIDAAPRGAGPRETPPPPPNGMRRISRVSGLEVTAQEDNNEVSVRTQSHNHPVDFTIKVPRQFSLKLATVNSGNIKVENVSGELEISNVNGSIQLSDVGGSAVLNTVNGNVTAEFKEVTNGTPMAFSSVNGRIDVSLPAKTKAAFKLKSDRGEIYSDFDLDVDANAPKVTRTAKDGTYRVSTDSWTYGRLNGGGGELMMKTLNGDIYIRKTK